jgi:hypothetical protein
MCDDSDDSLEGYCEKFKLASALHLLAHNQTTQDQNGVSYVRVQFIENLIKELDCSI